MTTQHRYHLIRGGDSVDEASAAGPHDGRRGHAAPGERAAEAEPSSRHYRENLTAAAVAIVQAMALDPDGDGAALLDEAARSLARARAAVQAVARGTG